MVAKAFFNEINHNAAIIIKIKEISMEQCDQDKTNNISKKFTVKNFALKNRKLGCWPSSESAIWALKAKASENGLDEAFIHVGRRVLIDEDKFWEIINRLQKAKKA